MSETNVKATSFRLPSRHILFLDHVAKEKKSNRTAVLSQILDFAVNNYLQRQARLGEPPPRIWD